MADFTLTAFIVVTGLIGLAALVMVIVIITRQLSSGQAIRTTLQAETEQEH
jgi:hypothetical protein